jgi:hypothetical protein
MRHRQALLPAAGMATKVIEAGARVMFPPVVATPASTGSASFAPSASVVPFNCTLLLSSVLDDNV